MLATLALLALALAPALIGDDFDWKRDRVVLANGKEELGVVIENCDPEEVVLLREGGHRLRFPRAQVQRVDSLRDRLASFMRVRRPDLGLEAEWSLVEDAQRAGLVHMARLQAWRILTLDSDDTRAHEFLGHERAGGEWRWEIDGKRVSRERFDELNRAWKSRLVLESEHFTLETDVPLKKAIDVLFDLEALYLWWMENLGPILLPAEDVDVPRDERMTFQLFASADDGGFPKVDSHREPFYDPSYELSAGNGSSNVAYTYFPADGSWPYRLFELGTECLTYSTLLLGKKKGQEAEETMRQNAQWVEIGMGQWVGRHCGEGRPGFVAIRPPFRNDFTLDPAAVRDSLGADRHELARLLSASNLRYSDWVAVTPQQRARCGTFVSFCIEADLPLMKGRKEVTRTRDALWSYLRDVYGTPAASSSSAFEDLLGRKAEELVQPWLDWVERFTGPAPGGKR